VDESIWLTQRLLAELFDIGVNTVNYHIKDLIAEGEVRPEPTIRKYRIVQIEGSREVSREVEHYNLDMVLAVGYRVRSPRGTAFRQWATARLSEYLVKGFTMDDQRLKNPGGEVVDYFDEMIARIAQLYAIEKEIRGRDPATRATVRQKLSKPIVEALRPWLESCLQDLSSANELAKHIRYRLKRWNGMIRFLEWIFTFRDLHGRSGSSQSYGDFARDLRKAITRNALPEYSLREIEGANGPSLSINRDPDKIEWRQDRRYKL
jgi:hypothetical protein